MDGLQLQPNEQIIHQGIAYHFPEMIGFTGQLYVTNQRLYFVTHPLNFKHYTVSFPLTDIVDVLFRNRLKFFPHGMDVVLRNGTQHRFAVWNRRKWKELILTER